ncbi:MAG: hypothetical protein K8S99_09740 [Planctomycetes bacterium]|nr:hypothetical protein [Planctomycetota bacterium]
MRCRTCGYILCNLRQPVCPECGTGFDIRSYKFTKETVAFACPYCDAMHAGQGTKYIPEEADTATCRACGREMNVACMRVVPLVPLDQVEAILDTTLPWEERRHLGRVKAWWKTCVMAMLRPGEMGRKIDATTSLKQAYWYAVWVLLPGVIVHGLLLMIALGIVVMVFLASSLNRHDVIEIIVYGTAVAVAFFVVLPLIFPLFVISFMAAPAHLLLRVLGKTRQPFRATAVGCLYATEPMWVLLIPVCGYYTLNIFQIWAVVSTVIVTKNVHKAHGGWATLAVLWFPVTLLVAMTSFAITR